MVWSVDPVRIVQAITAKLAHVGVWSVDPTPGVVRWPVLDSEKDYLGHMITSRPLSLDYRPSGLRIGSAGAGAPPCQGRAQLAQRAWP